MEQDWKPVVLKKKSTLHTTPMKSKPSTTPLPPMALDHDEKPISYFTSSMGKKIASLRMEKKWSQEDLAKQLCLSKKIIQDIEQGGKEKYSGPLVAKLKKVLGNFSW